MADIEGPPSEVDQEPWAGIGVFDVGSYRVVWGIGAFQHGSGMRFNADRAVKLRDRKLAKMVKVAQGLKVSEAILNEALEKSR